LKARIKALRGFYLALTEPPSSRSPTRRQSSRIHSQTQPTSSDEDNDDEDDDDDDDDEQGYDKEESASMFDSPVPYFVLILCTFYYINF
jgi:hypothetical protein